MTWIVMVRWHHWKLTNMMAYAEMTLTPNSPGWTSHSRKNKTDVSSLFSSFWWDLLTSSGWASTITMVTGSYLFVFSIFMCGMWVCVFCMYVGTCGALASMSGIGPDQSSTFSLSRGGGCLSIYPHFANIASLSSQLVPGTSVLIMDDSWHQLQPTHLSTYM